VQSVNQLIKQYTEMRQMMRQLSSSGMFGGGGFKSKMMRKMAGMPDMSGLGGDMGELPALPSGPLRKKQQQKKKKKKKRRR
jgi:signal recognition particle subunit SRP54